MNNYTAACLSSESSNIVIILTLHEAVSDIPALWACIIVYGHYTNNIVSTNRLQCTHISQALSMWSEGCVENEIPMCGLRGIT